MYYFTLSVNFQCLFIPEKFERIKIYTDAKYNLQLWYPNNKSNIFIFNPIKLFQYKLSKNNTEYNLNCIL